MKLLLQLTFLCLFATSTMVAQQKQNNTKKGTKTTVKKTPKMSKNNAVLRINEIPATPSLNTQRSRGNANRNKQRIVETGNTNRRNSAKKVSHREMIEKRKKITENY